MKKVLILFIGIIFFAGCSNGDCPNGYKKEEDKCIKYEYTQYDSEYSCDAGYTLYGTTCSKDEDGKQETVVANKTQVCPLGYEPVDGVIIKRCKKAVDEIPVE